MTSENLIISSNEDLEKDLIQKGELENIKNDIDRLKEIDKNNES